MKTSRNFSYIHAYAYFRFNTHHAFNMAAIKVRVYTFIIYSSNQRHLNQAYSAFAGLSIRNANQHSRDLVLSIFTKPSDFL